MKGKASTTGGGSASRIADEDVRLLASIAASIRPDYVSGKDDPWKDSPFAWIKTRPSRQRGKIGEQLVAGWAAAKGLDVVKCPDGQADKIIEGRRTEVKFSLLWESGCYVFQQIRNQDYSQIVCLGLSPFDAHAWVIPKEVALKRATPQHTGRGGKETLWLHVVPQSPPAWLQAYGPGLARAHELLRSGGS